MKKLLLSAILLGSAVVANAQDLTFAMEPSYPPFEFTNEKGEIIGFDVDIANAICKEIQATCHFKGEAFDSLITNLRSKRFDAAISAMDITEARAKQVLFSDPYYDSTASYVALKGKATLDSAKNVGVQNGTTFQQYTVAETKQYAPKSYASLQDAILDLKNGRIDIIFGDTAVLADMISKEAEIQFVGDKVTNKKYFGNGLGIAMNKSNKVLTESLNKGLAAIKANGEYQKIYDKWMTK
ncbi:transporter substrate-binding domain-containing protein [Aggregatibacter actinomycetemcomitans]|uniref:lysine/arginine/ornithine ABC transporter substrate-binding protein n=1 Tax=Aggregatibacter actinomycetemcomitans TaxID=714 RepID=UPI0011DAAADF|nr:lysine/arginine/ornithine ABC transporter substrate-binding protein [Aggregatibacter actinomycetemcomitans]QEH45036.1 transporter substrate-binding domain-containing protein [Aggregatibacter actinomycetemcomitans]QEH47061.1 transporter substrate-binding domain-containing protein [Aggregatibacter actinomycetemcomitans]TYA16271.1 transporter substrate-binding domain-containing protein [Aggregatibacter actinomycetemcomitans]TYA25592.1 transporter substrate-binding domain-containing protein [Agg